MPDASGQLRVGQRRQGPSPAARLSGRGPARQERFASLRDRASSTLDPPSRGLVRLATGDGRRPGCGPQIVRTSETNRENQPEPSEDVSAGQRPNLDSMGQPGTPLMRSHNPWVAGSSPARPTRRVDPRSSSAVQSRPEKVQNRGAITPSTTSVARAPRRRARVRRPHNP